MADAPPPILAGRLTLYRFFDVGYAIDLAAAERVLPSGAVRRHLPAQARRCCTRTPTPSAPGSSS